MADEDLDVRISLHGGDRFAREMRSDARAVDNLGDKAAKTARRLSAMSAASRTTRVNLGPFSTSVRGGALAIGGLVLAVEKLVPTVFGAAEALAVMAGGGAGAGAVGLVAYGQLAGTAALATHGLSDALGGNADAYAKLTPEQQTFVTGLLEMQPILDRMRARAAGGLLPGLGAGIGAAAANANVVTRSIGDTADVLGDLSREAGALVGGQAFGRDLGTLGEANTEIIDNLGHAGIDLVSAFRHITVEAAPLAVWLSEMARRGARLTDTWVANKREAGDLADFFREAREEMALLGSAAGHGGRGLINLFGAEDVDGTQTLANLDAIMARFERWSTSPAVQHNLADSIVAEIPQAVGAVISALAENLPSAAHRAGEVFWNSFWAANTEGKAFIAAITGAKIAGAIRGSTPLTPMFVKEVAPGISAVPKGMTWAKGAARAVPLLAAGIGAYELGAAIKRTQPHYDIEPGRPAPYGWAGKTPALTQPVPQEIVVHTTLKVSDRELARAYQRFINTERARGSHDSQQR